MLKDKEYFESFKKSINENYPTINVLVDNDSITLNGTLRIRDKKGKEIDSFLIEILVPDNFPKEIPKVREIGGRIPTTPDRHVDKPHGYACLYFRDAIFLKWDKDKNIVDFIKIFVEPYYLWQIEYEITKGKNKNNAFNHGERGAIQFYSEILNTDDRVMICNFVDCLTKKKNKHHWPCYCGSGKNLKQCHLGELLKYKKKIRRKDAIKTMEEFQVRGIC